jgi:site-specific DNA recombinase
MSPKSVRCAIYTRKSSEEGLDQAYNSLDAQRDACAAYISSQVGEGWRLLPQHYDDGGFSGGNLQRPSLTRLLADIAVGRIDVVVVYKVDRLTRSLSDFAKIVEVLDGHGTSFVSVTQAFNTTTSMGRLTLNVLLSFAQFEREVTGERIRDKIAASKKLGMWMGGNAPLGYRPTGRTLEIVPKDAATVRHIFHRYLELGSVHRLAEELEKDNIRSRSWVTLDGRSKGGARLARGALFHMLRNRSYLGEVPHKGEFYPGQHPPLLDVDLFEQVQSRMDASATVQKPGRNPPISPQNGRAPLVGILYDPDGTPMSPVNARKKGSVSYRYYVSRSLQIRGAGAARRGHRVAADLLEATVLERLRRLKLVEFDHVAPDWSAARQFMARVELGYQSMVLVLSDAARVRMDERPELLHGIIPEDKIVTDQGPLKICISMTLVRRGGRTHAVGPSGQLAVDKTEIDPALTAALVRAEAWKRKLLEGEAITVEALAKAEGFAATHASRLLRTAFLAPDLKQRILDGRQPTGLTLQAIMTQHVPLDWRDQRRTFAA